MTHLGRSILATCVSLAAFGCGNDNPSDGGDGRTVAWVLQVVSATDFGTRVWLDGEAVYSKESPLNPWHRVELERPYRGKDHVVEFEILAASVDPSSYTGSWSADVKPNGSKSSADGLPTRLRIGERLTIRISL